MEQQTLSFSPDPTEYIAPSWQELSDIAYAVAQKIRQAELKIDRIVTLAKGGWPMTRSMVDFLEVNKVASIGVKFYAGINTRLEKPKIYQDLPVKVQGEKVLLFDDVADTGGSLRFVKQHLEESGVAQIITATLFYKPHSVIKPDYFAETTDKWIIFPYEMLETTQVLSKKWKKEGIDEPEIKERLIKLGISSRIMEDYFG